MTPLDECVRCNHRADDHRHNDAGCGSPDCGMDRLPEAEPCRFRCTIPNCTCTDMIPDPRNVAVGDTEG